MSATNSTGNAGQTGHGKSCPVLFYQNPPLNAAMFELWEGKRPFFTGWRGEGLCRFRFSACQKEGESMSRIKRAYQYRFFPTEVQKTMLARTFGCCRYIYNWALNLKSTTYRQTGKS